MHSHVPPGLLASPPLLRCKARISRTMANDMLDDTLQQWRICKLSFVIAPAQLALIRNHQTVDA